ncbi:hypothetical protein Leryth_011422 [Lithospermum erythrorhizon]|nr:hypothetical protein Leryth_011422 [Lithospermum erythrorhizon]
MFRSNFHETTHFEAQINPNHVDDYLDNYLYNNQEFDICKYFDFDQSINNEDDSTSSFSNACLSQSPVTQEMTSTTTGSIDSSLEGLQENTNNISEEILRAADDDNDENRVVAFRVKTKLECLEDGYRWRKYGRKKVKSNSNPSRNYYKCTSEMCKVKKKVERDPQDSSYVITTYEGVHIHQSPTHIIHTLSSQPSTLHMSTEWNNSGAYNNPTI